MLIIWLFALFCNPIIALLALRDNKALQLANQSLCYIVYKNKLLYIPVTRIYTNHSILKFFHMALTLRHVICRRWSVRIGKNCALGLEFVRKNSGTVFPNTDRPTTANNISILPCLIVQPSIKFLFLKKSVGKKEPRLN